MPPSSAISQTLDKNQNIYKQINSFHIQISTLADFNNVNKEFLQKNSSHKNPPKTTSQKNPPKKFLPKNFSQKNPPNKFLKFPNNFSKNSLDFENIQFPTYIALRGRNPFRVTCSEIFFVLVRMNVQNGNGWLLHWRNLCEVAWISGKTSAVLSSDVDCWCCQMISYL